MKQQIRYLAAVGIVAFILVASSPGTSAQARAESEDESTSHSEIESNDDVKKQQESLRESQKRANKAKLEADKERQEAEMNKRVESEDNTRNAKKAEAKKKSCQNKESAIKKIITRTKQNGQHYYDVVTKIYANVKTYAEKKQLTLTEFADQIANIEAAAANAEAAVNETLAAGDAFNCDTDAPQSTASVFLASKKKQAAALRAYRDSVKQLLVAVKESVSTRNSSEEQTP